MNWLRTVIHAYLYLPYGVDKIRRAGPFGRDLAVPLPSPATPLDNWLKKALARHYVRQYHESSCSVASVVTAVNALRSGDSDHPKPITQQEILDKVRTGFWKERMSEAGHNGRRGLPLELLGKIVEASLAAYDIGPAAVETVAASTLPDQARKISDRLRQHLIEFETRGDRLLIAHFNQGAYLPTLGIPHISPVGGFDRHTGKVTILDVDSTEKWPYQIDFETFYKGLACRYNPIFRHLGYKNGGYVAVILQNSTPQNQTVSSADTQNPKTADLPICCAALWPRLGLFSGRSSAGECGRYDYGGSKKSATS